MSQLKFEVDSNYYKDRKINIDGCKLKSDRFMDYESMMPLEYYNLIMEKGDQYDKGWHIRPHHL